MAKRTTGTDSGLPRRDPGHALHDAKAEVYRCPAIEGAQQCVAATHSKMQNHRWGPKGETDQWGADGMAKPPDVMFDPALPPDPYGIPNFHHHYDEPFTVAHAHPFDGPHEHADDITSDLAAPPPLRDGAQADPPATPSGLALESSDAVISSGEPAGSGGGSGRSIERPDAQEAVLGAAMGVINPASDPIADPAFKIRHAEESARVLILGQHTGNMFQAIADKQFVANADLRAAYRKIRQMADFHGIDLDGGGS